LLEFIYTQTDKVISADYFFIALVSPASKEVYFAFYQERNERNQQKEGTAWPIAGDLFSEVITSQQPLKTDNYSVEAARRGMNPLGSLPIRAWAGVPLNAGTGSALGVLAIASTDAAVAFTEDQVSIFASIADLAATALDKARLFRETDERARQLTVLNDISTQLASEFEHIEALLGIITQSAVDILSAEAGSLLLADEQSGDLVFEVVIGGAGQNLIGTRIPPGVGIVGRVVETGRYVIVNEARKNPDWFGEVVDVRDGDAAAASFRTDSILAVPLTARGHVIGVLELINKRDRSAWVDNDVNLLTTFASQAAIAIENARLFRMTDEQLGLRVQQLDNMARIDQELNRTLDLRAVIDLTLDNALRESGADAGALALVRSDPLGFEVIGSVGYPLGTFTKDEVYPIDLGVIGRVYRTGSPSLVTELDEDPDYVETLPNAVGQLAVPMITAGKGVTAVLLLETREEGVFTMMNMSFIMALAEHANTAITNSQLFTQLQQANSARTQFVGFVAHELKNPMASIKGYSETLLAGMTGPLTDVQKNFVNTISRNVARMQQIVDDLRDLTALETGVLTVRTRPISFNNVIFESLRPLQRQIDEKGQSMYLEVPDNLPLVAGDEGRLIQVLTNFLSNASKYTPEGGSITVYAEATNNQWDADGAPEVIHCSVRDTGIGISQEDLKLLATPYFRSTNPLAQAETGTGLGMTITYALIEAHGGLVWVESEIGQGSTFHFTVPLALQTEVN
jgi:signal transduction histidine kinase